MEIVLEDDPDERKQFDQGKQTTSKCKETGVPLTKRCAGDAIANFEACSKAIDKTIASGGHVLVHCKASLSRSVAFLLAHMMRSHKMSLLEAAAHMKKHWDATWPCDRFVDQLILYEQRLARPHSFSTPALISLCAANVAVGAVIAAAVLRK